MAQSGDGRKLTGSDGTIYSAAFGASIAGDGVTPLPVGLYIVDAVAGTSGFPASNDADAVDIRVGDLLRVITGVTITPAVGDDVRPLTLTERCDVSSWEAPFSADEIETTTFCDLVKSYEKGKSELSGSISGIVTIGTTTGKDGFLRGFIDTIEQDGSTFYNVFEKEDEVFYLYLVANKNAAKGDEIALFIPANIFGSGLGSDQASAQTFDATFRPASVTGVNPALYRFNVA